VGGEPDRPRLVSESFAHQLPEIELAAFAHLGRARVAQVGIVGPYAGAGRPARMAHVREQRLERLHHVRVAHVPRIGPPAEHGAVIGLGIGHKPGVLLGEEVLVCGDAAIAIRVVERLAAELDELRRHLVSQSREMPSDEA
jgi:hypothetical protein